MTVHGNEARDLEVEDWLIINWNDETTRTRKSEPGPGDLGPRELATQLQLHITIPEVEVPTLEADVEVPAPKVEATELEDVDPEDVPDWQDVADELVDRYGLPNDWEEADVNALTVETLQETDERPEVRAVKHYVRDQLRGLEAAQEVDA